MLTATLLRVSDVKDRAHIGTITKKEEPNRTNCSGNKRGGRTIDPEVSRVDDSATDRLTVPELVIVGRQKLEDSRDFRLPRTLLPRDGKVP